MIELSGVTFNFESGRNFTFDLKVEKGVSLGIIGPSGAGKSTLLQLIAGFLEPGTGTVRLDDQDHSQSHPSARPVSMVFQSNNVFDHLDVASNVGLGISPVFRRRADAMDKVMAALARVGLDGFEDRRAAGLSGGEAQRVALARALVRDQPILLLDEPFAALGPSMRHDFTALLAQMQAERGLTMLTVSHAPFELVDLCSQLAFVADGKIVVQGESQSMVQDPPHEALQAYLGAKG